MWRFLGLTMGLLLAGCASQPPVPVANGSAPTAVEAAPGTAPKAMPAAPEGSYYVVQKGDTLYHIAHEHGIDARSLAAWNNIENPADVAVGRRLRMTPPDGTPGAGEGVVISPVNGPGQVTVIGETVHATGGNTEMLKREPRGGTVAWSDAALAQARAMDGNVAAAKANETPAADKPADKPAAAAPPAAAPPMATAAGSGVDWAWPTDGKVVAAFAEGGNGKVSNKGIDIAGRLGQPIVAAAAGKVTYVGNLRGYGDFVVVRHNAEFISVYAHAGRITVKKDQSVAKGQKIAEVGTSDADRPELHFNKKRENE